MLVPVLKSNTRGLQKPNEIYMGMKFGNNEGLRFLAREYRASSRSDDSANKFVAINHPSRRNTCAPVVIYSGTISKPDIFILRSLQRIT